MYKGVPTKEFIKKSSFSSIILANPKSDILKNPFSLIKIFAGFRSLCIIPYY